MSDSDEQTLNLRKLEAEIEKLAAERQKLQRETAATRGTQWRAWIVSLSVVVSIGVSAFGMYQTLTEIAFKNRQLGLQSEVQSNEVFLNQVLDRMSGIKVIHSGVDSETGEWITKSEDTYGDVIQVGSYGAAVALACRFDNLKLAAESALTFQLAAQRTDIFAQDMLARLESGCLPGWDQLTEQERSAWFHDQDRNQRD